MWLYTPQKKIPGQSITSKEGNSLNLYENFKEKNEESLDH